MTQQFYIFYESSALITIHLYMVTRKSRDVSHLRRSLNPIATGIILMVWFEDSSEFFKFSGNSEADENLEEMLVSKSIKRWL